jgi:hypothetical protein
MIVTANKIKLLDNDGTSRWECLISQVTDIKVNWGEADAKFTLLVRSYDEKRQAKELTKTIGVESHDVNRCIVDLVNEIKTELEYEKNNYVII